MKFKGDVLTHQDWNQVVDNINAVLNAQGLNGIRIKKIGSNLQIIKNNEIQSINLYPTEIAWAYNEGTTDIPIFSPCGLNDQIRTDITAVTGEELILNVEAPTKLHYLNWVVAAEPIKAGEVGKAFISGICPITIQRRFSDEILNKIDIVQDELYGTATLPGSAEIIWEETSDLNVNHLAIMKFTTIEGRMLYTNTESTTILSNGPCSNAQASTTGLINGLLDVACHGDMLSIRHQYVSLSETPYNENGIIYAGSSPIVAKINEQCDVGQQLSYTGAGLGETFQKDIFGQGQWVVIAYLGLIGSDFYHIIQRKLPSAVRARATTTDPFGSFSLSTAGSYYSIKTFTFTEEQDLYSIPYPDGTVSPTINATISACPYIGAIFTGYLWLLRSTSPTEVLYASINFNFWSRTYGTPYLNQDLTTPYGYGAPMLKWNYLGVSRPLFRNVTGLKCLLRIDPVDFGWPLPTVTCTCTPTFIVFYPTYNLDITGTTT